MTCLYFLPCFGARSWRGGRLHAVPPLRHCASCPTNCTGPFHPAATKKSFARGKRSKQPGESTFVPERCPSPQLGWTDNVFSREASKRCSNLKHQETGAKRRIFSSTRRSLRKADVQIPYSGYVEKKGESCRRCTTSGDPSTQNQH